MNDYAITRLEPDTLPGQLGNLEKPPRDLYLLGTLPDTHYKFLTIVGSRSYSSYGAQACASLVAGLAGYPISIVSGLALGIDTLAHQAALKYSLHTTAIPGSGLLPEVLYPATNRGLASSILKAGGALLSPFAPDAKAARWTFPVRNHVMAGIADAILIIEAGEQSGTLLTAEAALSYHREVLAVPGSIFSPSSRGCHRLLGDGARLVTSSDDIITALGLAVQSNQARNLPKLSPDELVVYTLLAEPRSRSDVIRQSELTPARATTVITALELKGLVTERLGLLQRT